MARRHGGRVLVRQGPRRATTWLGSLAAPAELGLNPATVLLNQSFTGTQTETLGPFTITRTIGSLYVASDQVAADESALIGIGFSVVSEQARAAGAASVPAPFRDEDDEHFFVYGTTLASMDVAGTVDGFQQSGFRRMDFDSKAQRKVESGDAIVIVLENASATARAVFYLKFRMLIKVH